MSIGFFFQVTKSCHGMMCCQGHGLPQTFIDAVCSVVSNNYMDDEEYWEKQKVTPFIQGREKGWLLIEFWSSSESKVESYLEFLKEHTRERLNTYLQFKSFPDKEQEILDTLKELS